MRKTFFLLTTLFLSLGVSAQSLKPGFNKQEYKDLMHVSAQFGDSAYASAFPVPSNYQFQYRSAVVGLENVWELYMRNDKVPVISIRGTTQNTQSWLANFYAAMVPAKGSIQLGENDVFNYQLASNLQFAYEYESMIQNGWAYNVVNSADWVPEVPISIQTLNDFNELNPFVNASAIIKKQKFPANIALRHAYNRMNKPSLKAQKNFQKYLGRYTSRLVKNYIPGFEPPAYFQSSHYVRTEPIIVLKTDEEYFKLYPQDQKNIFQHHLHKPYLYLLERLKY